MLAYFSPQNVKLKYRSLVTCNLLKISDKPNQYRLSFYSESKQWLLFFGEYYFIFSHLDLLLVFLFTCKLLLLVRKVTENVFT